MEKDMHMGLKSSSIIQLVEIINFGNLNKRVLGFIEFALGMTRAWKLGLMERI